MTEFATGNQGGSNMGSFMSLTIPVHLPTLTTNNPTASALLPTPQLTIAPQLSGWTDLAPERQGVDFGQESFFKYINNDTDTATDCWLAVRLDGLVAGVGGTNPRYPDDVLAQAIERVTFVYGTDLQILDGDKLHYDLLMMDDEETQRREAHLRGYNLSLGERITNATSPKWYWLRIPFWWTLRSQDAWHQYALQRLTRIVFKFRGPQAILQQEGANTRPTTMGGGNYIMDHFVRFRTTALSEGVKQEFVRRLQANGTAGQLYLFEDVQRLQQEIRPLQNRHVIQVNTFTKFAYNMRFVLRPLSALVPNYLDNDRFRLRKIDAARFDIGGRQFMPMTDHTWMTHGTDEALWKGNPERAIYNIPFSDFPNMVASAVGGIDFSNASNPQLTLYTDSLGESHTLDIFLQCYNYIRVTMVGNNTGAEVIQAI